MNTLRETAETFALDQWLSDYPVDMPYQEILSQIESGKYLDHDDIIIWEPIEDYPGEDIANIIEQTCVSFEQYAANLLSCTHE